DRNVTGVQTLLFRSGIVSTDWQIAGIGDFNGDRNPGLVWQNTVTGARIIWFMNGATHTTSTNLGVISTDWQIAGTGDFNGDGNRSEERRVGKEGGAR